MSLQHEPSSEPQGLEDKLGKLKDQLLTLRTAIKSFETDFDARLDACLQQIVSFSWTLDFGPFSNLTSHLLVVSR